MEGEPRSNLAAWDNYQSWIEQKKMQGVAKVSAQASGHNVWVAEWKIGFELMQITPGKPYSSNLPDTKMSLNIALGDVDTKAAGNADYGIRHEVRPLEVDYPADVASSQKRRAVSVILAYAIEVSRDTAYHHTK